MNFSKTISISFLVFLVVISIATGIYSFTNASANEADNSDIISVSSSGDYDTFTNQASSGYLQVTVTN